MDEVREGCSVVRGKLCTSKCPRPAVAEWHKQIFDLFLFSLITNKSNDDNFYLEYILVILVVNQVTFNILLKGGSNYAPVGT